MSADRGTYKMERLIPVTNYQVEYTAVNIFYALDEWGCIEGLKLAPVLMSGFVISLDIYLKYFRRVKGFACGGGL